MQLSFFPTLSAWLAFVTLLGWWYATRYHSETRESTYVANRGVGLWHGIISKTATWTQAPAIYISGGLAVMGPWYLGIFYVPNVLALVISSWFFMSMRQVMRDEKAYTEPQYMDKVYGSSLVVNLTIVIQLITLVGGSAGAIVGITKWLEPLLGIEPGYLGLGFGLVAIAWVALPGVRGGLVADLVKGFCFSVIVTGIFCLWWVSWGSWESSQIVFRPPPSNESVGDILWYGIPLAVSLISAQLCYPDIIERNYSLVEDAEVQRKVNRGSTYLFAFVLLALASTGVLALVTINGKITGYPAFAVVDTFGSMNVKIIVSVLLSTIVVTAIASYFWSAGSLLSVHLYQPNYLRKHGVAPTESKAVWASRWYMLGIAVLVAGIASIPGIDVLWVVNSLAPFRAEIMFPALVASVLLYYKVETHLYGNAIGIGMLAGLVFGPLLFFSGDLLGASSYFAKSWLVTNGKPLGVLCAMLFPALGFLVRYPFARRAKELQVATR